MNVIDGRRKVGWMDGKNEVIEGWKEEGRMDGRRKVGWMDGWMERI